MSYAVNGRQYVSIAAGGHGGLDTTSGDDVMVYALLSNGTIASRCRLAAPELPRQALGVSRDFRRAPGKRVPP